MLNSAYRPASTTIRRLAELPRSWKRLFLLASDAIALSAAILLADFLTDPLAHDSGLIHAYAALSAVLVFIPVLGSFGLYRSVVRYVGMHVGRQILAAVSIASFALMLLTWAGVPNGLHANAVFVFWAFALLYVSGSRIAIRNAIYMLSPGLGRAERVIIFGAGEAGARLLAGLRESRRYNPVAFVDDKKTLHGRQINGIDVHAGADLADLVARLSVRLVLIAMPAASRRRRQEIIEAVEPLGVRVQSLPSLSDMVSGRANVNELRDVDVTDLLGRDPVPPNPQLLDSCIRGKSVMVTGAGGSIGSELCRQILALGPRRLVLFEMSELALYTINQELQGIAKQGGLQVEILPLLGNAHHRYRVREVMQSCGVQTVYHAAAYKHVPMVEHSMIEGLHNNVISTWYSAEAALDAGVETFVLISTDKAVNPANIMGATKRFAELVLQGIQARSTKTRFCMVRFGNVLDSSGSVVPLFREQIRKGGPVTVTHPDVIRYFMTIPEAAQLVIQAGAMGKGGDVFVLDMGNPVRIDDLARRMISLMGLTVRNEANPDGDIEIQYTGLRVAEKLYEELLIGSNVAGTDHPRIMRAIEHSLPWDRIQQLLDDLLIALANFDCRRAAARLSDAVAEYEMKGEIQDYVWNRKGLVTLPPDGKVSMINRRKPADAAPGAQADKH